MVAWQLTIDANEPERLMRFWAPLLGYVPTPPPEGFATWNDRYRALGVPENELDPEGDGCDRLHDPNGEGPRIWFQIVPEPKGGKNRLHLDFHVTGRDASFTPAEHRDMVEAKVAEVIAAGGSVVRRSGDDSPDASGDTPRWSAVMADPEGNEFCIA